MSVINGNFVVIGGGVIGLMTALEIIRRGGSATIVDAGYPSASVAGAGILSALAPWRCPAPVATLIADNNKHIIAMMHEIENASGGSCGLRRPGLLVLTDDSPPVMPAGAILAPVHWLAPLIKPKSSYGIWMPDIRHLQTTDFISNLRTALKKLGAHFVHSAAQPEYAQNKITAVRLQNGDKLTAAHYIICAGARAAAICPPPAPPVAPVRGQLLLYRSPKPLICIVFLDGEELYMSPRDDDMILVGASSEDAGYDDRPAAAVQEILHRKAVALFPPLQDAQVINSWSGLRPSLPDAIPCIGAHPRYENLYLNVGHGRYGVASANAAARHLLKMIRAPETENPFAFREWADAATQ